MQNFIHRVLYAEDNEDSCLMVSTMCEFAGIEVVSTATVAGAWELAKTEYFDLYLLDSRFPDSDGLELCRRLRGYAPHTRFFFIPATFWKMTEKTDWRREPVLI